VANVTLYARWTTITAQSFETGATIGLPANVLIIGGKYAPTDSLGDPLTVISVTGNEHGNVSHDGSSITYTATSGSGQNDILTYTVGDAYGNTATGNITNTISPANAGYNMVSAGINGGTGNFDITFYGIPGAAYELETSTDNMATWSSATTIGGNPNPQVAGSDGKIVFSVTPDQNLALFRTRYVP
jgi:hypothetical protein